MMDQQQLIEGAKKILETNHHAAWTVPAEGIYPHQWLWDSCFITIGLRHVDIERAKTEIESLLHSQWANGMLPHIIFSEGKADLAQKLQEGWLHPHSPSGMITSGLTQPPMTAEAIYRVGQKMKSVERHSWYKKMLPHLIDFHQWIYSERVGGSGLAVVVHPYETGMDNAPHLVTEIHRYNWPWWLKIIESSRLISLASYVRRDTKRLPPGQRINSGEGIAYLSLMRRIRGKAFDSRAILRRPHFAIEDLGFNCIFIRANELLVEIAKDAGYALPKGLAENIARSKKALGSLWDAESGFYLSRSAISGQLIKEPSIAALLPLYSGAITAEQALKLTELLKKRSLFKTSWPVPSVPTDSTYFHPEKYWQGSTWINTNWLVIDGLNRYGYTEEAEDLQKKTLALVNKSGFSEYFNPLNGSPAGTANFSWTAALTIDLLKD